MTRSGLRAAVRPYGTALIAWFAVCGLIEPVMPEALTRAGFAPLNNKERGCWRTVVLGPGIVVKTLQNSGDEPPYSPRYRRATIFAPTIRLSDKIVVQPRGKVIAKYSRKGVVWREYQRILEEIAEWGVHDDHEWNFARFPDGSVRCIDY